MNIQSATVAANTNSTAAKNPATRKLSDMLIQELEPMSPLKVDFPDTTFPSGNDLNTTEEQTTHVQPTTSAPGGAETATTAAEVERRKNKDKSRTMFGHSSDVRYQEHDRGSWVNIKLVNPNQRNSLDSSECLKPEERGRSLDRVRDEKEGRRGRERGREGGWRGEMGRRGGEGEGGWWGV